MKVDAGGRGGVEPERKARQKPSRSALFTCFCQFLFFFFHSFIIRLTLGFFVQAQFVKNEKLSKAERSWLYAHYI